MVFQGAQLPCFVMSARKQKLFEMLSSFAPNEQNTTNRTLFYSSFAKSLFNAERSSGSDESLFHKKKQLQEA